MFFFLAHSMPLNNFSSNWVWNFWYALAFCYERIKAWANRISGVVLWCKAQSSTVEVIRRLSSLILWGAVLCKGHKYMSIFTRVYRETQTETACLHCNRLDWILQWKRPCGNTKSQRQGVNIHHNGQCMKTMFIRVWFWLMNHNVFKNEANRKSTTFLLIVY